MEKTGIAKIKNKTIFEEGFEYTQEKYGIPPTYDDYTKDTIRDLQDIMDDMPLNQPWRIKPKDWLRKDTNMLNIKILKYSHQFQHQLYLQLFY